MLRKNDSRYSVARLAGVSLLAFLSISGCQAAGKLLSSGSTAYDGAWVGLFQMSVGTKECTIKRGGVRVKIAGGDVSGFARFASRNAPFSGVVEENGKIEYGFVKGEFAKNNAEVVGQFSEKDAEGTWKSKHCQGTWNLRKVR